MAAISGISPRVEMILVDDGSTDGTLEAIQAEHAKDPRVRYVSLSRNFGHQMAITAGLDAAQGNTVAIMDGDLQDPPELIPELHAKYKEGFQVVYAKRRARLNCIAHLLKQIPYEDVPRDKVKLPDRQKPKGYVEPDYPWRYVPERY